MGLLDPPLPWSDGFEIQAGQIRVKAANDYLAEPTSTTQNIVIVNYNDLISFISNLSGIPYLVF